MKNQLSLSIPRPCSENWNGFTPDSDGRRCAVCDKVVTDFTGWGDDKIVRYIKENSEREICGRFQPTQLKTYVLPSVHANPLRRFVAGAVALFLSIGAAQSLRAQSTPTKTEQATYQLSVMSTRPDTNVLKINVPSGSPVIDRSTTIMGGVVAIGIRPAGPLKRITNFVKRAWNNLF